MSQWIQSWPDAPEHPVIGPAEVHVWLARLEQPEATLRALSALLSEDESERAGRFRFPRDREHFVAAPLALAGACALGRSHRRPYSGVRRSFNLHLSSRKDETSDSSRRKSLPPTKLNVGSGVTDAGARRARVHWPS